jgi:hypothetical protein
MNMISDDDLLLYYYRDGLDAGERARIGAALSEQPELAQRLHTLVARLDAAAAIPEVPVPEHVQQRWQSAVDSAARGARTQARGGRAFNLMSWQPLAVAATVVALVVGIQFVRHDASDITPSGTVAETTSPPANPNDASAYENGLKFHLASTERRLASLEKATPEERARLVDTIISQNRMYALAAERAGEPQLARVLRAFTPVLESVADDRSETTASGVAQLSFELRVMQARLGADAKPPTTL